MIAFIFNDWTQQGVHSTAGWDPAVELSLHQDSDFPPPHFPNVSTVEYASPARDWKCQLPAIVSMINNVLAWDFAAEFDAQNFISQFPLGPTVRPYFGCHQQHFRGVLCVMPQGWTWAPAIAQTTALLLTHKLLPLDQCAKATAFPWMDNFIMGASSMESAQALIDAFIARCSACHVTLKPSSTTPARHLVALGIEFDLCQHRYRLEPGWAKNAAAFVTAFIKETRTGHFTSLRTIWQAIGTCMWCASIHTLMLGAHMWSIINFMRSHTPKEHSRAAWESLSLMPAAPLDEMLTIADRLHANPWLPRPFIPPSIGCSLRGLLLITDASLWAGAFFVASSEQAPLRGQWWQWAPRVRDRSPNMPLLEALTLLRALQELELHHRLRPGQIFPCHRL